MSMGVRTAIDCLGLYRRPRVRGFGKPGLGLQVLRASSHARWRLHGRASPDSKVKAFGDAVVRIRE
jgi:hypothetical protein